MKYVDVQTQVELEVALTEVGAIPCCRGAGKFMAHDSSQIRAHDSSQVTAYGSSEIRAHDSSQVTAYGSSRVRAYETSQVTAYETSQVMAYDSSQVRVYGSSRVTAYERSRVTAYQSSRVRAYGSSQVMAYGSSHVRAYERSWVTCYESSQVMAHDSSQIRAYGSSQVMAYGSSQVMAGAYVAVTRLIGHSGTVSGGVVITTLGMITTAAQWCDFYGVQVMAGIATLYKAVRDDYRSAHGTSYAPDTMPAALDWNPAPECGGGLHFSPCPFLAGEFDPKATRFIACPVRLEDIVVHCPAEYPQKVKASRVCGPCYEVDHDGERIAGEGVPCPEVDK